MNERTKIHEPRDRVRLGDVALDPMTQAQVVDHVFDRLDDDEGGLLLTANVDHLRQVRNGTELARLYGKADLAVADGMPLVWASRVQGTPLPERVTGADLLWSLSEEAAQRGSTIYLLGGQEGSAERAASVLTERYAGLRVAGTSCPPLGFERDHDALRSLEAEVAACRPDVVFTGLGAPKQEALNEALSKDMPETWFVGVGAAIDMAAGQVQRAPQLVQRIGLEWLYRLAQEPRRLFRRYLIDGFPTFLHLLLVSARRRRSATKLVVAPA